MAEKRSKSPWAWATRLLTDLFTGANLVTLCLLWACCLSTWVNPAIHPRISVMGLLFPVFLFLNVGFLVLWLIYKPRMVLLPMVGMALCGSYILDYFPLNMSSDEQEDDLTVISWNTGYFQNLPTDSLDLAVEQLVQYGADIMCLQESRPGGVFQKVLEQHSSAAGYHELTVGSKVLLTQFPILSHTVIEAESTGNNNVIAADILMDGDTVTLLNAHLECYHFSVDEKDEYGDALQSRDRNVMKEEMKFLTGKLASASRYRGLQTRELEKFLDALPPSRSVILCGDFNDTPISYVYQRMDKRFDNAFRSRGFGAGFSYRELKFPVRIDHIFHSRDWECSSARYDRQMTASDHFPLVAKLRKRQK